MGYRIEYVDDRAIDGRDFLLCNKHTDGVVLYMNRGVRDLAEEDNVAVWEAAWEAFRAMAHVGEIPPQRAFSNSL